MHWSSCAVFCRLMCHLETLPSHVWRPKKAVRIFLTNGVCWERYLTWACHTPSLDTFISTKELFSSLCLQCGHKKKHNKLCIKRKILRIIKKLTTCSSLMSPQSVFKRSHLSPHRRSSFPPLVFFPPDAPRQEKTKRPICTELWKAVEVHRCFIGISSFTAVGAWTFQPLWIKYKRSKWETIFPQKERVIMKIYIWVATT